MKCSFVIPIYCQQACPFQIPPFTLGNRNTDGRLIAFPESAGEEEWKVRLAQMGIRYLKMTHAGCLEGGKKQEE